MDAEISRAPMHPSPFSGGGWVGVWAGQAAARSPRTPASPGGLGPALLPFHKGQSAQRDQQVTTPLATIFCQSAPKTSRAEMAFSAPPSVFRNIIMENC